MSWAGPKTNAFSIERLIGSTWYDPDHTRSSVLGTLDVSFFQNILNLVTELRVMP